MRVINHSLVPQPMQIAGPSAAPGLAECGDMNVVSTSALSDGMQRLVQVRNKVHQELQCLNSFRPWRPAVAENGLVNFNSIHHAVVMIGQGGWVRCIRVKAIACLQESVGIPWYVHKVPAGSFLALRAYLIRPVGNGREILVSQQVFDLAPCGCA